MATLPAVRATLLATMALLLLGDAQAQTQPPVAAPAVSNLELLRRLEAAEAELRYLRTRDAAHEAWQESIIRRLPDPDSSFSPASYYRDSAFGGCPTCLDGNGCHCESPPPCPGAPDYCDDCLEGLSWNKGGWRIVPFGRLRGEVIYSSAPYTNDAIIAFLNPNNPGVDEDATSVHAKQSQLNFAITGPGFDGWDVGGLFVMNFMGAQPLRNFSGVNVVMAYGEIKNERWRYAFGRMLDLFGPIHPNTVNQLQQRGAGNIGIYRGVVHFDRYFTISDQQRWTVSGRLSQPDISDYAAVPAINGQNNGWPNIETRVGVELGPTCAWGRPLEIGVSGVIGETQAVLPAIGGGLILPAADEVSQTRGICLDTQIKSERCGFRSEVWWGRGAGTYFVASLQTINPETDQAIESVGGWGEIYYKISPCLTTHVGYGIDDPKNNDLGRLDTTTPGPGQISYNDVAWWNLLYNVTDNFELGFEVSRRQTKFLDPTAANEGWLFHFSSTLNF